MKSTAPLAALDHARSSFPTVPTGKLRRAEHDGSIGEVREGGLNLALDIRDVRDVFLVNRSIKGHPHHIGVPDRFCQI